MRGSDEAGPSSTQVAKARLRAELLAARRTMAAADLEAARAAVRRHVLERASRDGWRAVAAYAPLRTEPGSLELLTELMAGGVEVLVPFLLADRDLDWFRWHAGAPAADPPLLGADAVARVDAVLAPALAVSPAGFRLGRGGGSYDRALARVPADRLVAALVFDGEVRDDVPVDPWDRPVTAVVQPSGWREVPGNAGPGSPG